MLSFLEFLNDKNKFCFMLIIRKFHFCEYMLSNMKLTMRHKRVLYLCNGSDNSMDFDKTAFLLYLFY